MSLHGVSHRVGKFFERLKARCWISKKRSSPSGKANCHKNIGATEILGVPYFCASLVGYLSFSSSGTPVSDERTIANLAKFSVFLFSEALSLFTMISLIVTMINQLHEDIYLAMETFPTVMVAVTLMMHGVKFSLWKKKLVRLLEDLTLSWNKELELGVGDKTVEQAKRKIFTSKLCIPLSVLVVVIHIVRPCSTIFMNWIKNENKNIMDTTVLSMTYPFAVDSIPKYVACSISELYIVIFSAFSWVGSATFVLQLCNLVSLHMHVIGDKLRSIGNEGDATLTEDDRINRLKEIIKEHIQALTYCDRIQNWFNLLILVGMVHSSISLGVSLICAEKEYSEGDFLNAFTLLSYSSGFLFQAAVYCDAGEDVSEWSESIAQAAYDCPWDERSLKFKKMLLLVMIRSQRPYRFTAYGFYDVNRRQLTRIVFLAYNVISMLRTVRSQRTS